MELVARESQLEYYSGAAVDNSAVTSDSYLDMASIADANVQGVARARGVECMQRIFLTLATVCVASIASAADLPVKAPVQAPAPVYSWTGFYIGGDVGALWTRGNGRFDPLPDVPFFGVFPNAGDLNKTAFVAGLHAGYNWQLSPSWVVGIEADWSWTDAKGSFTQSWISIMVPP